MDPGLDPFFDWSRLSPGNDTWTGRPYGFMNYGTKLDKVIILQFFGSLVVQVYEKFKIVRLLLDHIQF
jgi:hypothetical protein